MEQFLLIAAGFVFATVGGCIGHVLVAQLSRDAERRRVRREKLEELASVVHSVRDWLIEDEMQIWSDPYRPTSIKPLQHIEIIVDLYFSDELGHEVRGFLNAVLQMVLCVQNEAKRRKDAGTGGREEALRNQRYLDEYLEKTVSMINAQVVLMDKMRARAKQIDDDDWLTKSARYVWSGSRSDSPR